jgi:hypothetical protein
MSQARTVTALAVRELWMSFRLLLVLFAWVAAGAAVGLLPGSPADELARLAVGFGAAAVLSAAVAAWSLADERRAGRAGWLVTRSVARGTYLVGWFGAVAGTVVVGLGVAALLGWLSVSALPGAVDPAGVAAAVLAAGATATAAVALGLALGALLPRGAAATVVIVVAILLTAAVVGIPALRPWLPGSGNVLLAAAAGVGTVVPDALRAAGIGLALAALVLVTARVSLERAEL